MLRGDKERKKASCNSTESSGDGEREVLSPILIKVAIVLEGNYQMEGTHCRRSVFPLGLWADATVLSTTLITIVRRNVMPDEADESIGNLEAKLFDADGYNASSIIPLLPMTRLSRSRAFRWS